MKVVIADKLAIYVNAVYNNVGEHNGTTLLVATIFFTFQIYCDFAGYSYIAIGVARVMGFKLMTNFNRPYFSKSISEFWSKWHISLSSWFRDYLYIPLGGNRVSVPRLYLNLFMVFLISGLWHGANWTFIIWGGLNGLYLIFAIITKDLREKVNDGLGISKIKWLHIFIQIVTTLALCTFAWIFFRANNVHDAFTVIRKVFTQPGKLFSSFDHTLVPYGFLLILLLLVAEYKQEFLFGKFLVFYNRNVFVRYFSYVVIILFILLFGVFDGGQFIYFQF